MNGDEGIHGATTSACSQNKNCKDRNAEEGAELAEESLYLPLVTQQGIKTSLEVVAASLSIGSPPFESPNSWLTLETA